MISIIGSGRVGTAIAFLAASTSLDDILLINRTKTKAKGEVLDITNAISKILQYQLPPLIFLN